MPKTLKIQKIFFLQYFFTLKILDLDFKTSVMSLFGVREGAVRGSDSALKDGLTFEG